jgi:penicillin G amidase
LALKLNCSRRYLTCIFSDWRRLFVVSIFTEDSPLRIICAVLSLLLAGTSARAQVVAATLQDQAKAAVSMIRGNLRVPGLQKPVNVVRDRWGVAHIYAKNQHDLFFAQGFVVAQDRLFQMELWKRSGQGRLAEILGLEALPRDLNARRLRYRGNMEAEYRSYAADTKEILEAFTNGINAFIAEGQKPGGPGLPIEFRLAGFKPEKWKPEDCLNRMAAFSMTGNAFRELQHAQLVATIGAAEAGKLLDLDPVVELDPAKNVDLTGLSATLLSGLVGSDTRIQFPTKALAESNNWTISGKLTESGKPLLANDPHRVVAVPSLRYMVHLVAPGWDVIGAGEPGLPGVALGHNQNIAWGFTIFGLDQQDLYIEELNPDNPLQYKTANGWATMEVEKETFAVRGQAAVTEELKFTKHGPVMWQDGKRALAMRWVGSEPGTAGYLGSLAIDRASNWKDFEAAMKGWKVPSENIVYADRSGNIGEYSIGLAPMRNWTGLLPVPGNGEFEWSGFVPVGELPHSFNPADGYVATANNRMTPDGYPYKVGFQWYSVYRVKRIKEVLEQAKTSGKKLNVEDMENLQNDLLSIPARELVRLLRHAAGNSSDPAIELLLSWDARVTRESAAAALFELWMQDVTDAVLHKVAPESVWTTVGDLAPNQVIEILSHPSTGAFGVSPEIARDQLLVQCVKTATERLTSLEGPDPHKWSWSQLHVVRFRHPLDQAKGAAFMNLGPVARPGDEETVNSTGYYGKSFEQVSGASYREILDVSDWDKTVAINVPGQSGQPGSTHYSDLLPIWAEGQYFPLYYSEAAVDRAATDKLVLEP